MDDTRSFTRHVLATLSYRAAKPLRGAPPAFGDFRAHESARTPVQVVAHLGDLMEWAHSAVSGQERWQVSVPQAWEAECARFFAAVTALDAFLASDAPLAVPLDRIFQGPLADALTHVGQLSMLRRQAGAPVRGENYYRADIRIGATGADQAAPRREFD